MIFGVAQYQSVVLLVVMAHLTGDTLEQKVLVEFFIITRLTGSAKASVAFPMKIGIS